MLLPTDFSVQAEYAYLMVKKLEAKLPLEVHFLHVMNVPDTVTMDGTGAIQTCGEIDPNYVFAQAQIARRKLENLKVLYGDQIHVHFMLGKVTDSILKFSATEQFDLIVMGTKGSWGLRERLSGSETQMIARKSDIPVLSLMCDRSDLTIKQVLLVHNFSDRNTSRPEALTQICNCFWHTGSLVTKLPPMPMMPIGRQSKRI